MMADATLDEIVGTLGRLYSSYGLSPPFNLRRAAAGWTSIPLADIVTAVELHFLHHSRLYTSGSGDAYFHLIQRAVSELRDKHAHAEDACPKPSARRVASRSPSRQPPGAVTKLYRGAGYAEAFVDDDSMLDVSRLNAPQPRIDRRLERVEYLGLDGDDDPEDA